MTRARSRALRSAADGAVFAAVEDAEELGLHGGRRLGDLVEEDGAGAGAVQQPWGGTLGTGERPTHMSEQLALDQCLGQGR